MKRIIRIVKNSYKIIIAFVLGICISVTSVYAVDAYIESKKVSYNNKYTDKNNTQEAIDELYERSGIHQEKWIDPVLNGVDPVLKSPLIPVEIKPNGDVYYANLNSEWYNYSEKRWANAVILIDNPSNKNYKAGDHILEDDIESYFVWIPRYQYKIWNMANTEDYNSAPNINSLTNTNYTTSPQNAFNKARIIDVKFGTSDSIPKMAESEARVGEFYTHPAFTLGDKNLNGIWVGKFEVGYNQTADNGNPISDTSTWSTTGANQNREASKRVVVKPNVNSWRNNTVKNFFLSLYNYNRSLDSHMMKNTEWGAVAYLSHSIYGIGNNINVNNNSDYVTGYGAIANSNQETILLGETGTSKDTTKTQPYNSSSGYLASSTGNIYGVYDISGGASEYVAAYNSGQVGASGFEDETLLTSVYKNYVDIYPSDGGVATSTTYTKRILGDATGEMGPFYHYYDGDGMLRPHSSWYTDLANFIDSGRWFRRGGAYNDGGLAGQFYFSKHTGDARDDAGSRLVLSPNK